MPRDSERATGPCRRWSRIRPFYYRDMKILMVASEATPYAKTGGLADVIGSLPAALAAQGDEVAVVLPLYRQARELAGDAPRVYDDLPVQLGSTSWNVQVRKLTNNGVDFFFIDRPELYDRAELYTESGEDYRDNPVRFGVLCHAALGVARSIFRPQVIHYHDWQASLVAPLARVQFAGDPTFYGVKMLLTIHNLGYQGIFGREVLADLNLPERDFWSPDRLEFHGKVNLLKGGILFADAINTVSRGYAREMQTSEFGFGLEGLLQSRSSVLTGIVNGVDYEVWSPEKDPYLVQPYSPNNLMGKQTCKADLLSLFGLPSNNLQRPLIGMVSRFVDQKGFDLIAAILPELMKEDVCLVALGTGEQRYEHLFRSFADANPERMAVRIGYDNEAAHKIEAGADIFLMPSHYEPCGLNQIYSLRYGTVPVVRATGGLDDTIDETTGFKFTSYSAADLLETIRTALASYRDRDAWLARMKAGMARDFSWTSSAGEYRNLYRQLAG